MKYLLILFSTLLFSQQNKYEGKIIKSAASFQFKKASYYDYQINSKKNDSLYDKTQTGSLPENILSQKYADYFIKKEPAEKNELVLYSRITIQYNLDKFYFIKFSLRKNDKIIENKIVGYSGNSNSWKEFDENTSIFQKVKTILSLNNSAFSQFEIKENNPKYPEINKLKLLVRDADGTLNITKLAEVIEKNKKELAKYLEK